MQRLAILAPCVASALLLLSLTPAARAQIGNPEATPATAQQATLFGVGDIGYCPDPGDGEMTGRLMEELLDRTPNSRGITFGDNSNDDGSEESYNCLDRSRWGRLMPRLFPTPGNHDYQSDKLFPFYFLYFQNAGPPGLGYYAYDFGGWRIYALNSELMSSEESNTNRREAQLAWLESDLRANARSQCTMAYFHRPPFSSGRFASPAWVMPLFRKLYKHGVDLVATGHEHFFASLPPLTPEGAVDRQYGVPVLIAGTGGAIMFERPRKLTYEKDGEVVIERTPGILRITLKPGAYDWGFVPVSASAKAAGGDGRCHDNPPGSRG
jgi:hypothetical protein